MLAKTLFKLRPLLVA